MKYDVVVEYDPSSRHYTATVPGLPSIVVDAKSERTALKLAREAIAFAVEETETKPRRRAGTPVRAKIVTVDV